MPIPSTKITIAAAVTSGLANRLLPNTPGDFSNVLVGAPVAAWVAPIGDLDGDGIPEIVVGAGSDDDKDVDAGRIVVRMGQSTAGTTTTLTGLLTDIKIDGVNAGDLAGASVGSIANLNSGAVARPEILVGAPAMDNGALVDAGAAFVLWGVASGGIDLADPFDGAGNGKGFAIKGAAASDLAGTTMLSITDLNGDGKADILVGAPGVTVPGGGGGGAEGAVYVVYGKSTDSAINLSDVASGTGGFRIVGEDGGDAIGAVIGTVGDMNGDGKSEILIGAPDKNFGSGQHEGAAYVVFGTGGGTEINLGAVAAGVGGFRIVGQIDDDAGAALAGVGDVNGDGLADVLVGAARSTSAYVVFGKSAGSEVNLADVAVGTGGYQILGEGVGDLDALSVAGGGDFNRDGINDLVIGAPDNEEGGSNAGAVYVVWGGGDTTVDLSLIAQGIGGAKVVGAAGSLLGSSVAISPDMNGDTTVDLILGAPGVGESVYTLFTPASWQPDNNIYGTEGDDLIVPGYGSVLRTVGDTADTIVALGGNDTIAAAGGHDSIDGGAGADTIDGGAGNDSIDGGADADAMAGGTGDDTYLVDNLLDTTTELAGEGSDTVIASVNWTLADHVDNLQLQGLALLGTGNSDANTLSGTAGNNILDGGQGADTLIGGAGNDTYQVDQAGDTIQEAGSAGTDTVIATLDWILGDNLENLQLAGAARVGTGNLLANALTGTTGNDTLDGLGGNDTMTGGLGDDTYHVDSAADAVVESLGGGTDLVIASIDHTLALHVDNLQLAGLARIGTGNAANNSITGTAGDDTLDGAGGIDTLAGGQGNDIYKVDAAGDVIIEAPGGGTDTVLAAFDYILPAELENLQLTGTAHNGTGNAGANTITGGTGSDTLNGAGGADLLIGGLGDDTYRVDHVSDVVQEAAGGGKDTVIATVDYTVSDNIEVLQVTGEGTTGTGNAGDNELRGDVGHQSLVGGLGNDTLDGGSGGDTMAGGDGDDTYYVDDINDLVVESAGGGVDTVVTAFSGTVADNIENVRLTGTAHAVTGNAGNNTLSGNSGDDHLDGAEGDDLLLGGDGNDELHSHSGTDTLAGGSGDDVYKIGGGTAVHIEDFLGHDTIDASDATGDSYIDLSGETHSTVDNQDCDLGQGGTTAAPLDVQFLQDLSGSFGDDIANVRTLVPQIVTALRAVQSNSVFGVSSFVDKAINPFGAAGEWVYEMALGLTANEAQLTSTYNGFVIRFGNDEPEAQIESLMQLALHSAEVGFRPDSARFVVLFTDAPFHQAGDGVAAGITTPNNGDAIMDGGGIGEDYPMIAQVRAALMAANIIPIFAIANSYEATYNGLVAELGRGAVVTLTPDSSNVVAAISAGLTAATTTHIEDATGGIGNDTLKGDVNDNLLIGNGGHDTLTGGGGADDLLGGDGDDDLAGGEGMDDLLGGDGDDHLGGGTGRDLLRGGAGADHFTDLAAGLTDDQIADFDMDDYIEVTDARFTDLRYSSVTGLLELDTGDGSFATRVTLPTGLSGEFVATTNAPGELAHTEVRLMLDTDGDGVGDFRDNAVLVPNADQRDTDGDGYGNIVDADFNQDKFVDFFDLALFEATFFTTDANTDINGDGMVDFFDLALLETMFFLPPGQSYIDTVGDAADGRSCVGRPIRAQQADHDWLDGAIWSIAWAGLVVIVLRKIIHLGGNFMFKNTVLGLALATLAASSHAVSLPVGGEIHFSPELCLELSVDVVLQVVMQCSSTREHVTDARGANRQFDDMTFANSRIVLDFQIDHIVMEHWTFTFGNSVGSINQTAGTITGFSVWHALGRQTTVSTLPPSIESNCCRAGYFVCFGWHVCRQVVNALASTDDCSEHAALPGPGKRSARTEPMGDPAAGSGHRRIATSQTVSILSQILS